MHAYLRDNPCVDCGEGDVLVLDFDHRDRACKSANVATLITRGFAWERIWNEIQKCDVRCANCHRRRTSKQMGWHARR